VQRELKAAGKPFRAFEVLNLGRYERQAYLNVGGNLSARKREQALARKVPAKAIFATDVNYPFKVAGFDPASPGWFYPAADTRSRPTSRSMSCAASRRR